MLSTGQFLARAGDHSERSIALNGYISLEPFSQHAAREVVLKGPQSSCPSHRANKTWLVVASDVAKINRDAGTWAWAKRIVFFLSFLSFTSRSYVTSVIGHGTNPMAPPFLTRGCIPPSAVWH